MWPFARSVSEGQGCGNHHYDTYAATDDWRTIDRTFVWQDGEFKGWTHDERLVETYGFYLETVVVQRRFEKSCQHDGCDDAKTSWRTQRVLPLEDLFADESIGIDREEMKDMYGTGGDEQ